MDQPGVIWFCKSCSWSAGKGFIYFSRCPFAPENMVSRGGSAVPSRVSLLILHTKAESGAYSRDSYRFPRRRPHISSTAIGSVPIRVYQVTRLRTDGVHCRQSAGTEPVVRMEVPVLAWVLPFQVLTTFYASPCRYSLMMYNVCMYVCFLGCVFFPFILDFNGRTSRGHTGRR